MARHAVTLAEGYAPEDVSVAAALVAAGAVPHRANPAERRSYKARTTTDDPMDRHAFAVAELVAKYSVEDLLAAAKSIALPKAEPLHEAYNAYAWLVRTYPQLVLADHEEFVVVGLDVRLRPVAHTVLHVGGSSRVYVEPADVFRWALQQKGVEQILLAHGHPSGDPMPSVDDRRLTAKLATAGQIVGVPVIEHIVIGAGNFYSLSQEGPLT